jgi:hypothetical protein
MTACDEVLEYVLKKSWQSLRPALCHQSGGLVVGCGIGLDVALAMILQGSKRLPLP